VCLHGVPKKIVLNRGTQFTSRFWQKLHESMDTKLNFSSSYHPQTDGQIERTNHVLEDMLRAYALKYGGSWDKSLPFAEFSYNNSYCHTRFLKDKTEFITICMSGSSSIHIVTSSVNNQQQYHEKRIKRL
jgi:hypothetical protein